jgi:hypothetical protein
MDAFRPEVEGKMMRLFDSLGGEGSSPICDDRGNEVETRPDRVILRTGLNETFPLLEDCGRSTPSSARRSFRWLYRKEADGGLDSDKTHGR